MIPRLVQAGDLKAPSFPYPHLQALGVRPSPSLIQHGLLGCKCHKADQLHQHLALFLPILLASNWDLLVMVVLACALLDKVGPARQLYLLAQMFQWQKSFQMSLHLETLKEVW